MVTGDQERGKGRPKGGSAGNPGHTDSRVRRLVTRETSDGRKYPVFDPSKMTLNDVVGEFIASLVPVDDGIEVEGGEPFCDGYTLVVHTRLCRCRILGLGDPAAERVLKLEPGTVTAWRKRWPKLASDLDAAAELGNTQAAIIIQKLMQSKGPTAFQAARFFLSTHSPDFVEKRRVEVTGDVKHTVAAIRTGLYGLTDEESDEEVVIEAESEPAGRSLPAPPTDRPRKPRK